MAAVRKRVVQGELWQPLPDTASAPVKITRWEEPADPNAGKESQDATRVCKITRPHWLPGAAQTAVDTFCQPTDLVTAAQRANELIDRGLHKNIGGDRYDALPIHDRPRTMVAAVDIVIYDDGSWALDIFNAGDCDVQIHDGVKWIQPIAEMGYGEEMMALSDAFYRSNPDLDKSELIAFDNTLLKPELFDSFPLGLFRGDVHPLKYSTARFTPKAGVALEQCSVLVTTDGLRPSRDFQYENTRRRLVELSDPTHASENPFDLKSRDDKGTVLASATLSLLPDDVTIPPTGHVALNDAGPRISQRSSILELDATTSLAHDSPASTNDGTIGL